MKRLVMAVGAAAFFATMSLALAADATGTITDVDAAGGSLSLDDGNTYILGPSVKAATLKVGEKVTITFDNAGGQLTATAVKPAS